MSDLGERVRAERERQGLSLVRLAKLSGVSEFTVMNLEGRGGRVESPLLSTLERVAEALGRRAEDFLVAGMDLLDVAFELPAYADLGPVEDVEARLRAGIEALGVDPARFAVWPWLVALDGRAATVPSNRRLVLRVPAVAVWPVAALAGSALPGFEVRLMPPAVHVLRPASRLDVLVQAGTRESAESEARHLASSAGCCPSVTAYEERPLGDGAGWLCSAHGLSDADSLALQRLPAPGPCGLFVPG